MDEIHHLPCSVAARLAAMAATRSETSWIADASDGTVASLVQTHSDEFRP